MSCRNVSRSDSCGVGVAPSADLEVVGVEGRMQSEWVLVDVGDVVVHIMLAPMRALYNLEELWNFDSQADVKRKSQVAT